LLREVDVGHEFLYCVEMCAEIYKPEEVGRSSEWDLTYWRGTFSQTEVFDMLD
jgi:hypothetical protein